MLLICRPRAPPACLSGWCQPQLVARGAWLLEREGHHTSRVGASLNVFADISNLATTC
jgi:hypothetical protein